MEYTDTVYLRVYDIFPYKTKKLTRDYGHYPHGEVNSKVLLGEDWVYTISCGVDSLRVLLGDQGDSQY